MLHHAQPLDLKSPVLRPVPQPGPQDEWIPEADKQGGAVADCGTEVGLARSVRQNVAYGGGLAKSVLQTAAWRWNG